MKVDISVVIPTFNVENFIEDALLSITNQRFSGKIEIVIVDDCSTDNTRDIVEKFKKQHPEFLMNVLYQKENQRQGAARNRGLMEAKGDYVFFLDGDDFLDLMAFEKMFEKAEKNACDFVVCNWAYYKEEQFVSPENEVFMEQNFLIGKECEQLLNARTYFTVNKLYKRIFLLENKIFYGEKYIYEDYEFYVDVAQKAYKVGIILEALYAVRLNDFSTTKSKRNTTIHINSLIKAVESTLDKFNPRKEESYYFLYRYLIKKTMNYLHYRTPRGQKRKKLKIILSMLNGKKRDYPVPKKITPLYHIYFGKRLVQRGKISQIVFVDWLHRKGYLLPLFSKLLMIKKFLKLTR